MESRNVIFLQDQVQRLNNSLLWYQDKHGYYQEPEDQLSSWLTEERLLSPLMTEYDHVTHSLEERLKLSSDEYKLLKDELYRILKENDDLRKRLKETLELEADTLPEILKETDAEQKTVENIKKQLVLLSKEKEKVTEMYQEAMTHVKQLTSELQNLKSSQRWDVLEQQTSQMKNQYYNSVQTIVAEVEPLQNNLRDKESELMHLKIDNNTLQSVVEELQRKCKWKDQELTELVQKESNAFTVANEMKTKATTLENELKTQIQELEQIKLKNTELEKWIILQQEKSSTLDQNIQEIFEDKKNAQQIVENAILEKDLAKEVSHQKQEQVNHLQKIVDELMEEVGVATRKEVDEVKSQFNIRITKLNEKIHFLELECSEKEATLERSLREKRSAESELENVRRDCMAETKRFNEIKEQLGQRLSDAQRIKDVTERKLDKFEHQQERENKNINQKIELLVTENDQLKEQGTSLNEMNNRLSDSKLQLIQEINDLKAAILRANNERDEIQRTMHKKIALMKGEMTSNSQDFEVQLQSCEDVNHGTLVELKKLLNSQQIISARWKEECTTISNKSDEKVAQLRSELSRYKSRSSEMKTLLQESQVKMSETGQLLKEYTIKIQRMETQLRTAQQRAMEANRKLLHLQMKHREITSENRFLHNEANHNENNAARNHSHYSMSSNHHTEEEEDGLLSER